MHIVCPLLLFTALANGVLPLAAATHAAVTPAAYDEAIRAAYSGDTATALARLEEWHRTYPAQTHILYDLVTMLGVAGRHEAALRYFQQVVDPAAPAYAVKSLAASARAAGRAWDAQTAYELLITKTPDDAEAHAGLAYAWMAQGRVDAALDYVKSRLPRMSSEYARRDLPLIVALAELHEQGQQWLLAAATYQDVLRFEPNFRYAVRGRVFALSRVGAFHLAKRLADAAPAMFDQRESRQLAHDAAARGVLFGRARLAVDDGPSRYAVTDRALELNAELTRQFGDSENTQFDRLVALRDRGRMREVVDLYASLARNKADVPPYAQVAAADAYLQLELPEAARDLYRSALHESGSADRDEAPDWQIALMYAYSEAEQHDEAEALADRLLRDTPRIVNKGLPGIESRNPGYAQAALAASLMRLYADRLDEAQRRLDELHRLAPFHSGIRTAWASLQAARERPRAALEAFMLLQLDQPASLDAALGRADTLLALDQVDEARDVLAPLLARHLDSKAVQDLARRLESRDRLQLRIDATVGRGASVAGAETLLEAALYSSPLNESLGSRYRAFSRLSRAVGDSRGVSVARTRVGAGIDYRARDVRAEAEINHATGAAGISGMVLALSRKLSDAWQLHAALDTNVNALPAAAYRNGVTGRLLTMGATWIYHESRKAGGELAALRFSDGNLRTAAHLWWSERWISGPAFRLETVAALSASANSLGGASYFNPEHDREAGLTVSGEWLGWRRYRRSFRHRLSYTLGRYWQQGFAAGAVGDFRYEQEWRGDPNMSLRYGLGHASHPYDGNRERRNYGYMNLNWLMR